MTSTIYRLVLRARKKGLPKGQKPRSVVYVARRCKIARTYLYALMKGKKEASDETIPKLAKGLDVTTDTYRRASRRTNRR